MKFLAILTILLIMAVTLFAAPVEEATNGDEAPERAGRHLGDLITDGVNWVMNQLG